MKVSRWIYNPLFLGLCFGFFPIVLHNDFRLDSFLFGFISGSLMGLILQVWSYFRTKDISQSDSEADFSINQKRSLVVLISLDRAFNLCEESINSIKSARIKSKNLENGFIKAKTKMDFYSFGTEVIFNLKSVNEYLTEIEILTHPLVKGTLVDYGQSLKTIEKIVTFLNQKDSEINRKLLVESGAMLEDVYVKPFQREKV